MEIMRVSVDNLDHEFGLTLESHKQGVKDEFERRLVRLWRAGFLPHKICLCLNINADTLSSELEYLDCKGVELTPNYKTQEELVIESKSSDKHSKFKDDLLRRDYLFFSICSASFSNSDLSLILDVPYHYVNQLKVETHGVVNLKEKQHSVDDRNKQLCEEYKGRKEEYGIFSKLSKKYNMSRRNIDFILHDAGLRILNTKKPKDKEVTNKKQLEIAKKFSDILAEDSLSVNQIINVLGDEYNVSASHVLSIAKRSGAYQSLRAKTAPGTTDKRNKEIVKKSIERVGEDDLIKSLSNEYGLSERSIDRIIRYGKNR